MTQSPPDSDAAGVDCRRNVSLYPYYRMAFGAFFWFPVFFLFLASRVSLSDVLLLEAIYYLCVFAFEVPSGYVSDRFGRTPTLRLAAVFLILAYVNFFFGESFLQLAIAQMFLALGFAFNSGTDTALHFDSLASCGLGHEYGDREARVAKLSFSSGALAALIGGFAATFELRFAYGLSAIAGIVALVLALSFREPERSEHVVRRFDRHLRDCLVQLRDRHLRWIFVFSIAMVVVIHVPYQFYQPYLDALDPPNLVEAMESGTPLASGIHTFLVLLIGSRVAGWSMQIRRRLGLGATLLSALAALGALVALMSVALHWIVVLVLLLRTAPKALVEAPMREAVTPRLPQHLRASYLSLQSLAGRLGFGALLVGLSYLSAGPDSTYPAIRPMLAVSAVVAGVVWLYLAATVRRLEP